MQVAIIDRLDARMDGNYTLIEIKTGKFSTKSWKKTELRREMTFEKTTTESSPEFKKRFKGDIVEFAVYFPRSNDIMIEKFNWRTLKAMNKRLEKMRNFIEIGYFPCNVKYHCRYCSVNSICPMTMDRKVKIK